ncbi:hypothetical protein ACO0RG_002912 [Hanseniaspora osmophila]|uniref:Anaphase-promoting complex subunit 5 n=1 Tax=Hanseniaspora osmophila TaxID=56408 RepID=A0A1E5R7I9_9ASCO|nr:Anaphase-promoting complex subunit 5 [Hanseniaspora osmophila]
MRSAQAPIKLEAHHVYILIMIAFYAADYQSIEVFSSLDILHLLTVYRNKDIVTTAYFASSPCRASSFDNLMLREISSLAKTKNIDIGKFAGFVHRMSKIENVLNLINLFSEHILKTDQHDEPMLDRETGLKKISSSSVIGSYVAVCIETFEEMDFSQYGGLLKSIQEPFKEKFLNVPPAHTLPDNDSFIDFYIFKGEYSSKPYAILKTPQFLFDHYMGNKANENNVFERMRAVRELSNLVASRNGISSQNADLLQGTSNLDKITKYMDIKDLQYSVSLLDKRYTVCVEKSHECLDTARNLYEFDHALLHLALLNIYYGHLDTAVLHLENALFQARALKNSELLNNVFIWIFACIVEYPQIKNKFKIQVNEIIDSLKDYKNTDLYWMTKVYSADTLYKVKSTQHTATQALSTNMAAYLISLERKQVDAADVQVLDIFPRSFYETSLITYTSLGYMNFAQTYLQLKNTFQDSSHKAIENSNIKNTVRLADGLDELGLLKYRGYRYSNTISGNVGRNLDYYSIVNDGYKFLLMRDYDNLTNTFRYCDMDFLPYEFLRNLDILYVEYLRALENYDDAIQFCEYKMKQCQSLYDDRLWEFEFAMKQIDIFIQCSGNSLARYVPKVLKIIEAQRAYADEYRVLTSFLRFVTILDSVGNHQLVLKMLNYNSHFFFKYQETVLLKDMLSLYKNTIFKLCSMYPTNRDLQEMYRYVGNQT